MNAICDRWKDACDAPFSGTSATKTTERHGLCLCCSERKLWLDAHSNCIRSRDVCSKFCISTKQIEKGLCKLDTTHAGWRMVCQKCTVGHCRHSVNKEGGRIYISCILKVEELWMHTYHAWLKFENAESHSLMLPQKIVVRKSHGTLKVIDDMFSHEWLVLDHTVPLGTSVSGAYYAQLLNDNVWLSLCQNNGSCCNVASSSGQCDTSLPLWHPGLAAGLRLGSPCISSMLSRSCFLGILFVITSRNHWRDAGVNPLTPLTLPSWSLYSF